MRTYPFSVFLTISVREIESLSSIFMTVTSVPFTSIVVMVTRVCADSLSDEDERYSAGSNDICLVNED